MAVTTTMPVLIGHDLNFYGRLDQVCSPENYAVAKPMTNGQLLAHIKSILKHPLELWFENWSTSEITIEDGTQPRWVHHPNWPGKSVRNFDRRLFFVRDINSRCQKQMDSRHESYFRRALLATLEYATTQKKIPYSADTWSCQSKTFRPAQEAKHES